MHILSQLLVFAPNPQGRYGEPPLQEPPLLSEGLALRDHHPGARETRHHWLSSAMTLVRNKQRGC